MSTPPHHVAPDRTCASWLLTLVGVALVAVAQVIYAVLPGPAPHDVLRWTDAHRSWLQVANECRMFGAVALAGGVLAIRGYTRAARHRGLRSIGAAATLLAGTLSAVTVVPEGRLAYPLPGLDIDEGMAAFALSSTLGGSHAVVVLLAMAVATRVVILLREQRLLSASSGLIIAGLLVAASFPWAIPGWLNVIAMVLMCCWFAWQRPARAVVEEASP